jgi:GT2 family glycosyltransferase
MHSLGIAICTRNRWVELNETLSRLQRLGLDGGPLVIADDASDSNWTDVPSDWRGGLQLLRSEQRLGLVAQRNELLRACPAEYVLVVDDDSNPTADDFDVALKLMESPSVAVVGFPVQRASGEWQVPPACAGERRKAFTGCAHIVKKEAFFQVGGYRAELVHQGEESDLGFRLFAAGFSCVHCPEPVFEHRLVETARSYLRMDYYGTRNELLFADWYAPPELRARRLVRTLLKRVFFFFKVRRSSVLQGIHAWWTQRRELMMNRQSTTLQRWRAYQALPH